MNVARGVLRVSRGPLLSKEGPIGYVKGNRVRQPGHHTRKGGFRMVKSRQVEYVMPDLSKYEHLKPYVARTLPKAPPS